MPVISTDYTGRTVDAWAFSGNYVGELSAGLFSGDVCAGIVKLSQRWLVAFLTEIGSVLFRPDWGTSFMSRLRGSGFSTEFDVASAFSLASDEVNDTLSVDELSSDPDDERYDRCELLGVSILSIGRVDLSVRLYSLSGDSRSVLVPIREGEIL